MSKRVRFDENLNGFNEIENIRQLKKYKNNEFDDNDNTDEEDVTLDYKKKHTLDSDEEDESDKDQLYDIEKVVLKNTFFCFGII